MWTRKVAWMTLALAIGSSAGLMSGGQVQAQTTPPPVPGREDPEVLTSGPMHEAYAQPVVIAKQEPVVAPIEPPAAVAENAPATRPQGDGHVWVPGYWAWDAQRSGYIWVSGCWRIAPPGRVWVPGYWHRTPAGWEWISGFWAMTAVAQIEYLPAAPPAVSMEPVGVAPTVDSIWVPPCYYWRGGGYVLRTGYWLGAEPDWVWVPSHYVPTPHGYIFVAGHWDFQLERRGVLFAPVYFRPGFHFHAGFIYRPGIVVNLGLFQFGFFSYPRYSHYYYGDFYDDFHVRLGIYPRYECDRRRSWYDPIYVHDRWAHRAEPRWEVNVHAEFDRRKADRNLRPPHNYRELEQRVARAPEPQRKQMQYARPLSSVEADKSIRLRFEPVDAPTQQRINEHSRSVRKYGEDRRNWESQRSTTGPVTKPLPPGQATAPTPPGVAPRPGVQITPRSVPTPPPQTTPPPVRRETGPIFTRPPAPTQPKPPVQTPAQPQSQTPIPSPFKSRDRGAPAAPQSALPPPAAPSGAPRMSQQEQVKIPAPPSRSRDESSGSPSRGKAPPSWPKDEDRRGDDRGRDRGTAGDRSKK